MKTAESLCPLEACVHLLREPGGGAPVAVGVAPGAGRRGVAPGQAGEGEGLLVKGVIC